MHCKVDATGEYVITHLFTQFRIALDETVMTEDLRDLLWVFGCDPDILVGTCLCSSIVHTYVHIYMQCTYIHMYVFMYVCMCVCVCVCVCVYV